MVEVVPTTKDHLPALWDILKGWPGFLEDGDPTTYKQFERWWGRTVVSGLTGLDKGKVVGCGFLDGIYEPVYATIVVFKKKGYLNPKMISAIMKDALPYFFHKHDIASLRVFVRKDYKASLSLLKRLGFKKEGKMRRYKKINGIWHDYVVASILREEVL